MSETLCLRIVSEIYLNFNPMFHFFTFWKRQKTFGFLNFLIFSEVIEIEHLVKMGWEFRVESLNFQKHFLICFNENPLKMRKNTFYFMLKAIFICPTFFDLVGKRFDKKKAMGNFKTYDITDWTTNNYDTHIAQHLKKQKQTMKCGQ